MGANKGTVQTQKPTESNGKAVPADKRVIFEYPELPKWEMRFYWLVLMGIFCYAYSAMYDTSRKYGWKGNWNRFSDVMVPLVGKWRKDRTNYEWVVWVPVALKMIPALIGNSIVFNWAQNRYKNTTNELFGDALSLAYSLLACSAIFGWMVVAVSVVSGLMLFGITRVFRHPALVWLTATPILYYYLHNAQKLSPGNSFLSLLLLSYKMLSFISYNLDYCRNDVREKDRASWARAAFRMNCYAFYMPYLVSLIVIYSDYERQMEARTSRPLDWRAVAGFAARVTLWFAFCDLVAYLLYFDAIIQDPWEMRRLPLDRLCIIGMTVGEYFHLKYVVIFGLPAVFARLDRMDPPAGPICVSRLMLFSKAWRSFDRGLYSFFKSYIFVPICAPTFALWRKIVGVLVSYCFVLVWHGFAHQNLVWIALNIGGLFLEMTCKAIYVSWPAFREAREKYVSDRMFRRILAWLLIVPYAMGLYSNFYFLGGKEAGWIFVDRFFYGQTVTLKWPFFLIITLGYCYANVCMEVHRLLGEREKRMRKLKAQ